MKQQEAVLKAQAAAEKNRRDEEKHQADMLNKRIEAANKLRGQEKTIGEDQKTANAAKSEVAQQYPFVSAPGRQTPMGMEYGALPDQTIENGLIQNRFSEQVQAPIDARQAMLAANMAQVPGFGDYSNTLGAQAALAQATTDRKTQEKQAEADRQFEQQAQKEREAATLSDQRARSRMDKAARIAAQADTDKALALHRNIRDMGRAADAEVDPLKRADKQAEVAALVAQREADMTRLQPDALIKYREETFKQKDEYRRQGYTLDLLKKIEQNPDLLGFQAPAIQYIRQLVGSATEILDFVTPVVDRAMQDPSISDRSRQRLEKIFIEHQNPDTGAELTEAQLLEASVKWQLVMQVNASGRVTQKQLDSYEQLTNFMDPLKPRPVARDVVRGTIRFMEGSRRAVNKESLKDRGILFEPDGRILGDEPYNWGQPQPQDDSVDPVNGPAPVSRKPVVDPVTGNQVTPVDSKALGGDPVMQAIQAKRKARQSGSSVTAP